MSVPFILDTNSFRVFSNYYPDNFPTFWENIELMVDNGHILSCREVMKEILRQDQTEHITSWVGNHPGVFGPPSEAEMSFVSRIFAIPHFQQMIGQKQRLRGYPVADPFLIARGANLGGCIVTEEIFKPNAAKIPNVCKHFGVKSVNAKEFLAEVGWSF
jgi:hypothetical protein